jgi:alkylhydroperoxidase family enzyme
VTSRTDAVRKIADVLKQCSDIAPFSRGKEQKMPSAAQRVPSLPPAEWTDEVRDVFELIEGPAGRNADTHTNSVLVLANHPELATAVLTFHKRIAALSPFPLRLREMVILRVAWLRQTQYATGQHRRIGRQAGLTDIDFRALEAGDEADGWSPLERLAVRAAGEMCQTSRISAATWAGLEAELPRRDLMVLVYLIGQYELNCWMFNAMQVEIEPELWDASLPPA